METTQINPKTILFFIGLIIVSFLCFRNCNDKSKFEIENNKYAKSNDSLNILFQKSVLEVERYERDLKKLNDELLIAQNNSQISETKYYALKNKTVKPKYVESIIDCNDTIQSIYKYALAKDSLCDIVITDKNRNEHYRKMLALKDPTLKYDEDDAYYIEDLEVFVEWANQTVISFFTLLN